MTRDGTRLRAATPVEVPFDFYGTYEITVRAPDHETQTRLVPVSAPFYQYPIVDFFAEYLVPWTIRDVHVVEFELEASPDVESDLPNFIERMSSVDAELEKRTHGAVNAPGSIGTGPVDSSSDATREEK